MEKRNVFLLLYSSTNEDSAIPYVECLGVYPSEDIAIEELIKQYHNIVEDEFDGNDNDCVIKRTDNYFSISDQWYSKNFVCSIEEKRVKEKWQ